MLSSARLRAPLLYIATLGLALTITSPATAAEAPPTPTDLFNGYRACSTDVNAPAYLPGRNGVLIEGVVTDPSGDSGAQLTEEFKVWPVSDPTQITSLSNPYVRSGWEGTVTVPASALIDGQTYAWQSQAVSAGGSSDWTAPCYFTVDNTRPSSAPAVTSSNYPQGQESPGGEAVEVTLSANGIDDVEGFAFSWTGDMPVACGANIGPNGIPQPIDPYASSKYFARASALGGSTTLRLIPPNGSGPMSLTVASLDRACNRSATTTYSFSVSSTAPTIKQVTPNPEFDEPAEFVFQPNAGVQAASRVVSYTVQFYGETQETITVKASPRGKARFRIVLDGTTGSTMYVTSKSENGWVSDDASWYFPVDTTPTVSSDIYLENEMSGGPGTQGAFTFTPKVKDVVSYTYSFDYGQTLTTVEAGADGVGRITWAPDQSGYYSLEVYATTRNGHRLSPYSYFFGVS